MGERAGPTIPAATSARDVLLATKLHLPSARREAVPRSRLIERLQTGIDRGLVLVCAPAGYGKTALLAQWIDHIGFPAAWLSLDASDNDPIRFWRHAVAALDGIRTGIAEHVRPLLGASAPGALEGLVTVLINELAGTADDALLVLDDYHVIDAPAVHESVAFLLEHPPPGLHVTVASRSDPPLPLARMRARGELTEVRAADLRFTTAEAAALLHAALGPARELSETAVAALVTRTEGWAAGLQLAALSLRGQPDPAEFIAAFTGSHRHVLDYLTEEVLERETEQTRTFLLATSVLERLSAELCNAVTGRDDSQALLEYLDRSNLFLIPLDEVRGWWRYHHLFADLLRARLQRRPGRAHQLHRLAATWYEQHGLPDDAIHHTLAAGDAVRAARLIERHFDTVFNMRG
jgi:LuxR family maltose regulon positive regulatory protein